MSELAQRPTHIVLSKLRKPVVSPDLVARPRLLERLDRGLDRNLVLVSASAGYGKTTLLLAWLEKKAFASAWVTLDRHDNELVYFLSYFVAAVQTLVPGGCYRTHSLLNRPELPPPHMLANTFANEISELAEPICIVLDDYHVIHNGEVHEFVAALVRLPLPNLHLVIATRRDPPIALSRLRGSQQIAEIRADHLRFTGDETEQLLRNVLATRIETEVAARLHERTEGWAVGLRIAAVTMRDYDDCAAFLESFRGTHREIAAYLIEEVLARETPAMQRFLLCASIPNRFSAALCDALLATGFGRGTDAETAPPNAVIELGSQDAVGTLAEVSPFVVRLDHEGEWFRYHPLFRELLVHRLQQDASEADVAELHSAAGVWFEENDFLEDALNHLLAARRIDAAAHVVARHWRDLLTSAQWQRLGAWLRLFTPDALDDFPDLLALRAWLVYQRGHYVELRTTLLRLDSSLHRASLDTETVRTLRGEIGALASLLHYYDIDPAGSITYAQQAIDNTAHGLWIVRILARLVKAGALQMKGDLVGAYATIYSSFDEEQVQDSLFKAVLMTAAGFIYWIAADLLGVERVGRQAVAFGQTSLIPEYSNWGHYHQGCAFYHLGDLTKAEQHFTMVVEQPYLSYGLCYLESACGLATLLQCQARSDEALSVAESTIGFMLETGNTSLFPVAEAFRAELSLQQGKVAQAVEWADHFRSIPPLPPMVMFYSPHLTLARVLLAQNTSSSRHQAGKLLQHMHAFLERVHNIRCLIEVLALQAMHRVAAHEKQLATSTLEKAIRLAQPGGFVQAFVELGPQMADLLMELKGADDQLQAYVSRILAAFDGPEFVSSSPVNSEASSTLQPEVLTSREMDVLRLLAQWQSDQEIAKKLVISLNTVWTHNRNIYAKLDVHSRYQAVARARKLGLLPTE